MSALRLVYSQDANFISLYNKLFSLDPEGFPLLSRLNLAYYQCYSPSPAWEEFSFIVADGDRPLLGVPVFGRLQGNSMSYSSCGVPCRLLVSSEIPDRQREAAGRLCKTALQHLVEQHENCTFTYCDSIRGSAVSIAGKLLLDAGARAEVDYFQAIDLTLPEQQIHAGMTKSFKHAVNWGEKNLRISLLEGESFTLKHLENFKDLHVEAAGRETRPWDSWLAQYDLVTRGEGFVVLGELDNELVSAALFITSHSYVYYGVSASRRSLFDRPISHALLWTAIRRAKEGGCRIFETGTQLYPGSTPPPSSKELGISRFKRSFGGETYARLVLSFKKESMP